MSDLFKELRIATGGDHYQYALAKSSGISANKYILRMITNETCRWASDIKWSIEMDRSNRYRWRN